MAAFADGETCHTGDSSSSCCSHGINSHRRAGVGRGWRCEWAARARPGGDGSRAEHCPVGDSARGQLLLPVELCSTHVGVLSPRGLGAAGLSPSPRLSHPQGDPAKRGRGEREAKGFLFSRCFIMGLLVPKKCFESIREGIASLSPLRGCGGNPAFGVNLAELWKPQI